MQFLETGYQGISSGQVPKRALIEAVFRVDAERVRDILNEMGMEPEEDGTIILSREISLCQSKNTCRINGKMVSATFMKAIGGKADRHMDKA